MTKIKESELVLAENNTVYHIRARRENVSENIILVGDPGRVPEISSYFDKIDFKKPFKAEAISSARFFVPCNN